MEISDPQLEDLVAQRLLATAEVGVKQNSKAKEEDKPTLPEPALDPTVSTPDFIKVEKNLASFGFFTPSNKKIKGERSKVITFSRKVDGKQVDAKVTIAPSSLFGLPITADQDKYLALQKIIGDRKQETGEVRNPIGFTSAELLRLLGRRVRAGKNYDDIAEWLKRMTLTGIISEGVVYFADRKAFVTDTFHVFERAVSYGSELENGETADRNYVWLSDWQLKNINNNYLLPIDFETYKQLKNHIAKALVPYLQIWLLASSEERSFEKRYDALCQILNVRQYKHLSEIIRNFGLSLDELKAYGYLADWKIEKTSDRKAYKVVFIHGEKFRRDRRRRLDQKDQRGNPQRSVMTSKSLPELEEEGIDRLLLTALIERGITEAQARKLLLTTLTPDQHILDQLEWGDSVIAKEPSKIKNPAGFYIHLIKENVTPPANFESTRKRRLREEASQAQRQQHQEEAQIELAYEEYQAVEIDEYLLAYPVQYEQVLQTKQNELSQRKGFADWSQEAITKLAERATRAELARGIPFTTFEAFAEDYKRRHRLAPEPASGQGSDTPEDSDQQFLTV